MKYSQEQLKSINKRYRTINNEIQLKDSRAKAIQSIIIDKQLPEDLLDPRNSNDIENDKFAKKALLNKYSREILGTADIEQFQKDLIDSGVEFTFLNQYPEILRESKNFRKATPDNIINITKRLANRNSQYANNQSIIDMLKQISKNLELLSQKFPQARKKLKDQKNKVDATLLTGEIVGETTLATYGMKSEVGAVMDSLIQTIINTNPEQESLPDIDPTGIIAGISQSSLTTALENVAPQDIEELPEEQPIFEESKQPESQKINTVLEEWQSGDNNYKLLNKAFNEYDIDQFREFIMKISNIPKDIIYSKSSKKNLLEYFKNYVSELRQEYLNEEENKKSLEERRIQEEENNRKIQAEQMTKDELRLKKLQDEKQMIDANMRYLNDIGFMYIIDFDLLAEISDYIKSTDSNYKTTVTDGNRVKLILALKKYYERYSKMTIDNNVLINQMGLIWRTLDEKANRENEMNTIISQLKKLEKIHNRPYQMHEKIEILNEIFKLNYQEEDGQNDEQDDKQEEPENEEQDDEQEEPENEDGQETKTEIVPQVVRRVIPIEDILSFLGRSGFHSMTDKKELEKISNQLMEMTNNQYNYDTTAIGTNGTKIKSALKGFLTKNTLKKPKDFQKTITEWKEKTKSNKNPYNDASTYSLRLRTTFNYFFQYDGLRILPFIPTDFNIIQSNEKLRVIMKKYLDTY